jgi:quinol monooxygenase YgiN
METVHVLAIITAKPGRRAEILEAFQANVPNVHAEDGCIEYVATITPRAPAAPRPPSARILSSWSRSGPASMRSRPTPPPRTWRPMPRRPGT